MTHVHQLGIYFFCWKSDMFLSSKSSRSCSVRRVFSICACRGIADAAFMNIRRRHAQPTCFLFFTFSRRSSCPPHNPFLEAPLLVPPPPPINTLFLPPHPPSGRSVPAAPPGRPSIASNPPPEGEPSLERHGSVDSHGGRKDKKKKHHKDKDKDKSKKKVSNMLV